MKVNSQVPRFCTCSDLPSHLAGRAIAMSSSFCAVESDRFSARPKATERAREFCTCSQVPTSRSVASATENRSVGETVQVTAQPDDEGAESNEESRDVRSSAVTVGETDRQSEAVSESTKSGSSKSSLISSVSDLLPGESELFSSKTHGRGGSDVVLTENRVLLRGAADEKVLHATMRFSEIDSVTIARSRPSRRSLAWGLIGVGASVGMWQALDGVGNLRLIIAVIVVLMSVVLLADYFLRPPDLLVGLRARSGAEMNIAFGQSHSEEADRFAARVISMMEMQSED